MTIRIVREPTTQETTMGVVFTDGVFYAFSLEDAVREVDGQPVDAWKVPGMTAIPAGRYPVTLTWSPRFERVLPEVQNVPGFSGVRIHPGNSHRDTEGCILVGVQRSSVMLQDSKRACDRLQAMLLAAELGGAENWLTVENPR